MHLRVLFKSRKKALDPFSKLMLIMQLTIILLLVSFLQVSATAFAQNVTITGKNVSLQQVFKEIRRQTGYNFIYTNKVVKEASPVTLDIQNGSVSDVLDVCFSGQPLTYTIDEKIIIVSSKLPSAPSIQVDNQVTGVVRDSSTGSPLAGVSIQVKGSNIGTTTDEQGSFQINVPEDAVLEIRFLGYKTIEIPVNGRHTLQISLAVSSTGLNQLVVVGYGVEKKKDLTGAIAHIDATKYNQFSNVSLMQSLHGAVAGLNVGAVDAVGEDPDITIRGQNTLSTSSSDNSPLIVVDGIIYRGNISDLNTEDIQSVDVLKDASAAAIYGSQASNGVVLITTKKGGNLDKAVISYSAKYSLQVPSNKLTPLNTQQEGKFINDLLWEQSRVAPDYLTAKPNFDITSYLKTLDETEGYNNGVNNDWWGMLTGNGHIQQHDLSIAGSSQSVNYFVSGGLTDQAGFVKNDNYKRYNIRANMNSRVTDWLHVGFESFLTLSNYSGVAPSINQLFHMQPFASVFDTTGQYSLTPNGTQLSPFLQMQIKDNDKRMNLFGNFHSDIKLPFLPGFNYRLNYSHNYITSNHDQFDPWGANYTGSGYKNSNINYNWALDNIISYKRIFNDIHSINLTFVYGVEEQQTSFTDASAQNFNSSILGYNSLESGDPSLNTITTGAGKNTSLYSMGRLVYSFKEKYLLTGTVRRDGYSGFGTNDKVGVFPSLALGWIVSEENFFKKSVGKWFDYFKLRASYGTTARRALSAYQTQAKVTIYPARIFGDGGTTSLGQYINSLANNDLHWETTTGLNLGFDFGVLQSRIHGDFEYYSNNTKNILYNIQLPYLTGFSSIATNIGKVKNHGFEFTVSGKAIESKNFSWDASVNFSSYRNKIVSILGEDNNGDGKEDDIVSNKLFIGKPERVVYDYKITGMWQLADKDAGKIPNGFYPGTYKIEDFNNDGKYGADDKQILGYQDPSYRIGISNTIRYRNISLYLFINTIQGGKHYYYGDDSPYGDINQNTQNQLTYSNVSGWDYWMPENPNAKYRRLDLSSDYAPRPYEQRNFIRLQDVSLTYGFSNSLIGKYKLRNLKVYFSGSNLFTLTKWKGWDPETGIGIVAGMPVMASYTLGLNLQF